jgi:hypothetical protein
MTFFLRLTRGGDFWCSTCQLSQLLSVNVSVTFLGMDKSNGVPFWSTIPCQFHLANEKQREGGPEMDEHHLRVYGGVGDHTLQEGITTRRNRYMKISISGVPPGLYVLGSTLVCKVQAHCHKCLSPLDINHTMKRSVSLSRKTPHSESSENLSSLQQPLETQKILTPTPVISRFCLPSHQRSCEKEVSEIFHMDPILTQELFIARWRSSSLANQSPFEVAGTRFVGSGDFQVEYLWDCMVQLLMTNEGLLDRRAFSLYYEALKPFGEGVSQIRQMVDLFPQHALGFSQSFRMLKLTCSRSNDAVLIRSLPNGHFAMVKHVTEHHEECTYDASFPSLKSLLLDYLSCTSNDVCRRCTNLWF